MRNYFSYFFMLVLGFFAGQSQAGLIIHFDMEQSTAPLIDLVGGKIAVEVGAGHEYGLPSYSGQAVNLTGNGSWQLSVAESTELNNLTNNFTVAAWVYLDSMITKTGQKTQANAIIGDDTPSDGNAWALCVRNSTLQFAKFGVFDAFGSVAIPHDKWVHIAVVVSSVTGVELFLDGVHAETIAHTGNIKPGDDAFAIGRIYSDGYSYWWPGRIDELRVYDTVLDSAAILQLASDIIRPVEPITPFDKNYNTPIDLTPTLQWQPSTDPNITEYILYFSDDVSWVTSAPVTDSNAIVLPVEIELSQHHEPLTYETTYYWRIDEVAGGIANPVYITTGPIWSFRTKKEPQPPCAKYTGKGDISGNCFTDITDLALLGQYWMDNSGQTPADIDGNGNVGLGDLSYVVADWLSPVNPHTIMVVSCHPDDEGIFFGGALAYYSQTLKVPTVHISMTSGDRGRPPEVREEELINADTVYFGRAITASIGLPPDTTADLFFPRFKCILTTSVDKVFDGWNDGIADNGDAVQGKQKAIDTIATYIRIFRPEVIITHDFEGEYGHYEHKATAIAVADSYDRAADVAYVDGNAPWQAMKLYIHQSQNGLGSGGRSYIGWLFHDYWEDTSIDSDGVADMTPRQVVDIGLGEHISQGYKTVSTVYRSDDSYDGYHCEWWALYRSTVGADIIVNPFSIQGLKYNDGMDDRWAIGDFFQNLGE